MKATLIIDGNYLMMNTLSVMGDTAFSVDSDKSKIEKDSNMYLEKLTQVLAKNTVAMHSLIDNVIIVRDFNKSWRKDLFIENSYNNSDKTYKGNRKSDSQILWDVIYNVFDNFVLTAEKICNFNLLRIKNMEGDDLIFAFSTYLNSIGKSVIIWSGDSDLKQLVSFNKLNNSFVIFYQKISKKIWVDLETANYLSSNSNQLITNLSNFSRNAESDFILCSPIKVVLEKVLMGESGDNIPSIIIESKIYKSGEKKGQTYLSNITAGQFKKINNDLNLDNYSIDELYNEAFLKKLVDLSIKYYNSENQIDKNETLNHLKLNIQLVVLHKNSFPISLFNSMYSIIENTQIKQMNLKPLSSKNFLVETAHTGKHEKKEQSSSLFSRFNL